MLRRLRLVPAAFVSMAVAVVLVTGGPAARVLAAGPDRADVVLVLDFSASILRDATNRNRFAAALDRIAHRVDEKSADLTAGDTTVTIVRFATRAADYAGCSNLRLLGRADAVGRFADCLRSVAAAYRRGLDPALTRALGVDTNYVAAMQRAATHLPSGAVRPTLILFTDGKHDVRGVPASRVQPVRNRLFASRSPIALLPVGMGLNSRERPALEAGLLRLRLVRDMPACVGGAVVAWPRVVFNSPDAAGNAVAVALQDATCTFTAEPPATLPPTSVVKPDPVREIRVAGLDSRVEVTWEAPGGSAPVVDYRVRCGTGDGSWVESAEGVSLDTHAIVAGLTNGASYRCEVGAVAESGEPVWTPASTSVVPIGPPAAPPKPVVGAMAGAVTISLSGIPPAQAAGGATYRYECSSDNGQTWPSELGTSSRTTAAQIGNLANGTEYVCRAYAANAAGLSPPSPLSDAVRPCGSPLDCNPAVAPIIGLVGALLAGAFMAAIVLFLRESSTGYVVAVLDYVHTANLGHGGRLGIAIARGPGGRVTGISQAPGRSAEIGVRVLRGGRFAVTDRRGRHVVADAEEIVVVDRGGVAHQLSLRAFSTRSATQATARH